jgi:hypothetical protein
MENKSRLVSGFIIGTFVTLYLMVSVISTIHVIDFFKLSNPNWLAISLAIAFEVGAAASLASLIALKKMNKGLVWMLFFLLTAMQAMGNTYYAYVNLKDFTAWSELFGLVEEELIFQKRVLSIVSGAILPIVALGFIKSLVDYIKPEEETAKELNEEVEQEKEPEVEPQPEIKAEEKVELEIAQEESNDNNLNEPLIYNVAEGDLLIDSGGSLHVEKEEDQIQMEETERLESEHNGRVIVEEKRVLPKAVELPSVAMNPTRL